ncbi:MAG: hypothetical protein M3442_16375, partial [Chloroflexota bacterium]|nr:hypothetical protein [Chloroflexota bacterium]
LGLTIGIGGLSNLVGALVAERVTRRFGVGPTILGTTLCSASALLIPLAGVAGGGPLVATAILGASQAFDASWSIYDINVLSTRQAITPPALLGRVNATMQLLGAGLAPLGALAGGALAELIGVQATLTVAVAGIMASALWLVFSPLPALRTLPSLTWEANEEER